MWKAAVFCSHPVILPLLLTSMSALAQTKKAEQLVVDSGGCCGLCVIFFLVGIIVLLVATNYACYVFNKDKC